MAVDLRAALAKLFADLTDAPIVELRQAGVSLGNVRALPRRADSADLTQGTVQWTRRYSIHVDHLPPGFEPYKATSVVEGGHELQVVQVSPGPSCWRLYCRG